MSTIDGGIGNKANNIVREAISAARGKRRLPLAVSVLYTDERDIKLKRRNDGR